MYSIALLDLSLLAQQKVPTHAASEAEHTCVNDTSQLADWVVWCEVF